MQGVAIERGLEGRNSFVAPRAAANEWRGACLGKFADVEQRVSLVLLAAAADPAYACQKTPLPHLVGPKFVHLRKLLPLNGPMKRHATSVIERLDDFSRFDDLRTHLCHGSMKIAITEEGEWLASFKVLCFRSGLATRSSVTFTQGEADTAQADLWRSAQILMSQLGNLEKAMRTSPTTTRTIPSLMPV